MATMYMNRFAIEEDDQFEIHVKHSTHQNDINLYIKFDEKIVSVPEEVMIRAKRGSGYFCF